jgi:hypothetical protein
MKRNANTSSLAINQRAEERLNRGLNLLNSQPRTGTYRIKSVGLIYDTNNFNCYPMYARGVKQLFLETEAVKVSEMTREVYNKMTMNEFETIINLLR